MLDIRTSIPTFVHITSARVHYVNILDLISIEPKEIRRRLKAMRIFETVKSADKLLFLIIEYLNQRRGSIPTNSNLVFTH